jgi:hypothetical protein
VLIGLAVTAASDGVAVAAGPLQPKVTRAARFDTSPPLRQMPVIQASSAFALGTLERGAGPVADARNERDGALQVNAAAGSMPSPVVSFEGLSSAQNPFMLSPPDPVGDVGPQHYVEMVNVVFGVFSKQGQLLFGPAELGTLWQGFLEDCQDPSGDPIVLYDEIANRWLLSQFTTRGPEFFNCVAVSTTPDPLGSYFRYAFSTGPNFPDYPKYGVWPDGYYITTREFDPDDRESIGIYAIDRRQVLAGDPVSRMVSFQLTEPAYLVGDGLLPADLDGDTLPPPDSPAYLVGSMDAGARDRAPFDGLNVFHLRFNRGNPANSRFALAKQVPIAPYDTIFPCSPTSRSCIPQPRTANKLDILSYRQRPTWRLAYRNFGTHESLVTNQSVEARPGIAGVRWWELRNPLDPVLHQEGTWAPDDGVHRWMGSAAMDEQGNLAVGYSVSNADDVFPGIRYAGRLATDPLGELGQGEAVLIDGAGSQTASSRWGDYTSLNVDPSDDCTFWYVNEYYAKNSARGWQTRIGAFRFPGCS